MNVYEILPHSYLLCDRKSLHLNVSRGKSHRSLRLTGRTEMR